MLISGGGTNLQALIDATRAAHPAEIAVVVSNRADAYGLERARAAGIPAVVVPSKGVASREAYDHALIEVLRPYEVQWIALAGFLRIVTPAFLSAYANRVINIHPSLLPAFPGLHGQDDAVAHGVRVAGATVHLVDAGMDTGPILCQGVVPVLPDDSGDDLRARILTMEHRLYPMALRWAVEGRLRVDGRRVYVDLPPGDALLLMGGS